jgi:septum formation protein
MASLPPFILASTSPRRIQLLKGAGLKIKVISPNVDETPKRGEKPPGMVLRLAQEKAESIIPSAQKKYKTCFILAADTTVAAPHNLGKPESVDEAKQMLRTLSGKKHTVYTGYCLLKVHRNGAVQRFSRVVETKVKMRALTDTQIQNYIASGEPMDKAGAYGAQGLGMSLIEGIEGSYSNVIGLPITQVFADLEEKFKIPLLSWMN